MVGPQGQLGREGENEKKWNGHTAGLEMVDWILRSGPLFLVVKFPPVPMRPKVGRKVGLLGKLWDTHHASSSKTFPPARVFT
jgi:hypothetical protein